MAKTWMAGALLAVAAWAGTASAAEAGISGPELAAILQEAGYKAKLDTDGQGDPLVHTTMSGLNVDVYFYDCKAARCGSLQFWTGLDLDDGSSLAVVNRFNHDYRYVRAFLDEENDPILEFDFELPGGDRDAYVTSQLQTWEQLLGSFMDATGFRGGND